MAFCSTFGSSSPLIWNTISRPPNSLNPSSAFLANPCSRFFPVVVGVKAQAANNGSLGLGGSNKSCKRTTGDASEQKWVAIGLITESLPNGMFWVRLENGDVVLGYICGKIRRNSIRMLPGDKVKIEVSRYDSTRGRIVYRIRNKD